jgi:hypothetical protein
MQAEAPAEANPVQRENARPGTAEWRLTNPALHREIEGYVSLTSVNRGYPIKLYVHTQDRFYKLEIYRMRWRRWRKTGAWPCDPSRRLTANALNG